MPGRDSEVGNMSLLKIPMYTMEMCKREAPRVLPFPRPTLAGTLSVCPHFKHVTFPSEMRILSLPHLGHFTSTPLIVVVMTRTNYRRFISRLYSFKSFEWSMP